MAAPWAVQMKFSRSPVGNGSHCSCSAEARLLTMKCCCSGRPVGRAIWSPSVARRSVGGTKSSPSGGHFEGPSGVQFEPPCGVQFALRGQLEEPSGVPKVPKRLQFGPKRRPRHPSWAQEVLKSTQVGSKRRPRGSKLAPRGVQEASSWLQEAPK